MKYTITNIQTIYFINEGRKLKKINSLDVALLFDLYRKNCVC